MTTSPPFEWAGPPRFLPPTAPVLRADGSRHHAAITYAVVFGYRPLQLDVWVPATVDRPPLVVYVHGGAWMLGDRRYLPETLRPDQLFDALLAAGLAVASVDYRLVLEAAFPAQLHDLKAAVRYLRAHADGLGIDAGRIGVLGESAGGHLAALLGLTAGRPDLEGGEGVVGPSSAVDVVVDWYGPADLDTMPRQSPPPVIADRLPPELLMPPEDRLLADVPAGSRRDASPAHHVGPDSPPFLLVHGTADPIVPFEQSVQFAAVLSAAGVPVTLEPVEGAGHIFAGHPDVDGVVDRSVEYLRRAVGGRP